MEDCEGGWRALVFLLLLVVFLLFRCVTLWQSVHDAVYIVYRGVVGSVWRGERAEAVWGVCERVRTEKDHRTVNVAFVNATSTRALRKHEVPARNITTHQTRSAKRRGKLYYGHPDM